MQSTARNHPCDAGLTNSDPNTQLLRKCHALMDTFDIPVVVDLVRCISFRERYLFPMQCEGGYRCQLLFSCCWLLVGLTLPWLVQLKKHFIICANMTFSGKVAEKPADIVQTNNF